MIYQLPGTCRARLFVDDTSITVAGKSFDEMGSEVEPWINLKEWLAANKLSPHTAKMLCIVTGYKPKISALPERNNHTFSSRVILLNEFTTAKFLVYISINLLHGKNTSVK